MLPPDWNPQDGENSQQQFSQEDDHPQLASSSTPLPIRTAARHPVSSSRSTIRFGPVNLNHIQGTQNLHQPTGAQPTINPVLLQNYQHPTANVHESNGATTSPQNFAHNFRNGHSTNPSLHPMFNQYSGMSSNSFQPGFAQAHAHGPMQGPATSTQLGNQLGMSYPDYGSWGTHTTGMNPALGLGGVGQFNLAFASLETGLFPPGQPFMNIEPAMVNGGGSRRPRRGSASPGERWTDEVIQRLWALKEQKMSHKDIVKTLKTEFPFLEDLNENIVSKRLATLRDGVADPIKLEKLTDRVIPSTLGIVVSEFLQFAEELGYERLDGEREDFESGMREWFKAMARKLILRRKIAQGLAMGPA
ncbi:hypothetical protein QBC32DRAFT_36029 [Pseudoneurospora amorphoporcata]|uniref:Uncharacterized protein n=1 Tax=Pseudoneurospora amorphoporcata TaxID=241081 RepID=A0AAN6NP58_9PEZI|nr:hypothetical protein QBC32DRAFT_36029 [Pseudoneurospora amorphoporcata]